MVKKAPDYPDYAVALRVIADEVRELAKLAPADAVAALQAWVDRTSPTSAERRLATARRLAAEAAVEAVGSQAALARLLGIGTGALSRIVTGNRAR